MPLIVLVMMYADRYTFLRKTRDIFTSVIKIGAHLRLHRAFITDITSAGALPISFFFLLPRRVIINFPVVFINHCRRGANKEVLTQ